MKIVEAIKNVDYEDVAIRAMWTFLQAFLAVFMFVGVSIVETLFAGDWNGLWALLVNTGIAAVAAGLSALKTVVLDVLAQIKEASEE